MATRGRPRKTEEEKKARREQLAKMNPIERLENADRHLTLHKCPSSKIVSEDDEDDNRRFLKCGIEIMNLPEINLDDFSAVENRISEYFEIIEKYKIKPGIVGLSNAFSLSRKDMYAIVNNRPINIRGDMKRIAEKSTRCLKKAYMMIEQDWENQMQNGKINPASGIFLGKNHYGYTDVQEHVLTTEEPKREYSPTSIGQRYLTDDAPADPPLDDPDGSVT